ncbi:UvrD-helicase domain-containing protein [Paenibacillus amylolyticus]|uniref:DNA 3'-5' helicase n=1 Tax=Paenibacillus amylolyticus TaxID=1451 RepID=A0A124DY53_PAEAM|nr:ATP-dependent helicase [Paenibacillus amylolyticus]GAS83149.1 unknown protein [Paenibacillus amylolyticus]
MGNSFPPTDEQNIIIEETGNLVVTAKPGSGKTFTVVEKISVISKTLLNYQGVIAISFTNKASDELELRCRKKGVKKNNNFFGTIDKFYISEIIIPFAKLLIGKNVTWEVKNSVDDFPKYARLKDLNKKFNDEELLELLQKSLSEGYVFLEICAETAQYILNVVPECISYLLARYTHIFIDEYQDCGKFQHHIFLKLVDAGMVGIAVGDLNQAIYAFSQRYSKFLFSLISNEDFRYLEITKNHRCHKSISDYSLALMGIPNINLSDDPRVFKTYIPGTDHNIFESIDFNLPLLKERYNLENNNDFAILCRGNETAKRAAEFLRTPNKLFVETALDRSNSHWGIIFNDMLSSYFMFGGGLTTKLDFVQSYFNEDLDMRKFERALNVIHAIFILGEEELISNIDLFICFAEMVHPDDRDLEVCNELKLILGDTQKLNSFKPATENEVNIMTLHKSKGLEFKVVFHLDLYRWILPFEGARTSEEEYIQALNLHYVGVTRAVEACYIMQATLRYRPAQGDLWSAEESPFLHLHNTSSLRQDIYCSIPQVPFHTAISKILVK